MSKKIFDGWKPCTMALPNIGFIGDGNQGFSRQDCLLFVSGVKRFGGRLVLLEQPLIREDLEGLHAIRHLTGVPVVADGSVRSLDDARRVVKLQAADDINIKIMKTGVMEAFRIAAFAHSVGLRLMIGGMVETRIAQWLLFQPGAGTRGIRCSGSGYAVTSLTDPVLAAMATADPYSTPGIKPDSICRRLVLQTA